MPSIAGLLQQSQGTYLPPGRSFRISAGPDACVGWIEKRQDPTSICVGSCPYVLDLVIRSDLPRCTWTESTDVCRVRMDIGYLPSTGYPSATQPFHPPCRACTFW